MIIVLLFLESYHSRYCHNTHSLQKAPEMGIKGSSQSRVPQLHRWTTVGPELVLGNVTALLPGSEEDLVSSSCSSRGHDFFHFVIQTAMIGPWTGTGPQFLLLGWAGQTCEGQGRIKAGDGYSAGQGPGSARMTLPRIWFAGLGIKMENQAKGRPGILAQHSWDEGRNMQTPGWDRSEIKLKPGRHSC